MTHFEAAGMDLVDEIRSTGATIIPQIIEWECFRLDGGTRQEYEALRRDRFSFYVPDRTQDYSTTIRRFFGMEAKIERWPQAMNEYEITRAKTDRDQPTPWQETMPFLVIGVLVVIALMLWGPFGLLVS